MKIAIFGGTFDPIHNAHLAIVEAARNKFDIDKVLVIPAANPPHKAARTPHSSIDIEWSNWPCEVLKRLESSRLEDGEERSYSIRTIEKLRGCRAPEPRYISHWLRRLRRNRDLAPLARSGATVEFIVVMPSGRILRDSERSSCSFTGRCVDASFLIGDSRCSRARQKPLELPKRFTNTSEPTNYTVNAVLI